MDKDLEVVLWMVSVQLHDMRKNIKNGLPIDMEMLDGIINGIEAVMNGSEGETSNDASALPIPDVSCALRDHLLHINKQHKTGLPLWALQEIERWCNDS